MFLLDYVDVKRQKVNPVNNRLEKGNDRAQGFWAAKACLGDIARERRIGGSFVGKGNPRS